MKKYVFTGYLLASVVLMLYYLNLLFIGLDFWNRNLRNYSDFIPVIGFLFLLLFSVFLISKKYYGLIGIIISILALIFYGYILIISLYFTHFEYQDKMIFSDDTIVEVYLDTGQDKIYFLKQSRFLQIFSFEKCLFWYMPLKWDNGKTWKKENDNTFSITGYNDRYEIIDIDKDLHGTNCSCYDNTDIESEFCLFNRGFRFSLK